VNKIIENKVLGKDWTFQEISNIQATIETLSREIMGELTLEERYNLIKELRINESFVGVPIEQAIAELVLMSLKAEVADKIKIMLSRATVNFGGNKNEVSEGNVGRKSHKERTTDEKNNSKE